MPLLLLPLQILLLLLMFADRGGLVYVALECASPHGIGLNRLHASTNERYLFDILVMGGGRGRGEERKEWGREEGCVW